MEGDERPQKMRKLSHDQEATQTGGDIAIANPEANATHENEIQNAGETAAEDNAATTAPTAPTETPVAEGEVKMSKNQLKKQRKKEEWEAGREDRKVLRKEKVVAKRERKKAAKAEAKENGEPQITSQERRQRHIVRPVQLPVTIVLDCDFDELMRDNERISLASQITRCYSDNKNSKFRANLTVSSFGGHLKERFEGLLNGVYKSWKGMRFLEEDFVQTAEKAKEWMADTRAKPFKGAFAKYADMSEKQIMQLKDQGEVVYLSSESDETLTELKPFSTYIVGGLVDKNREKGICHKRATERNVRTAKLPIGEYLEMSSRKVLATNHVNEIMVHWLECGDWGESFMKVMPKRKGGKLREDGGKGAEGDDHDHEGEDIEQNADEGDGTAGPEEEQALKDQAEKAAEVPGESETPEASTVATS
ncbi:hypothetical protein Q7P37_007380 [Cladosporium fusiforme]